MLGFDRTTRASHSGRIAAIAGLGTVALTILATACGETPTSPHASMATNSSARLEKAPKASLSTVDGLLWTKPVAQTSASAVIGPAGGTVSIPNGLRLIVPQGAVTDNVTFSITRLPGTIVAYDFEPHGMAFLQPLTIQQPTVGTNLAKLPPITGIQAAYFLGTTFLDQTTGKANVAEFEPTFVAADKAWITFTVVHFSGYMIATGRTADPE